MKGNPSQTIGKKKLITVALLTVIALFASIIVFVLSLAQKEDYSALRHSLLSELQKNQGAYDEEVIALNCDYATAQALAEKTGGQLNMQPSATAGYIRLSDQKIDDFVRDPAYGQYLSCVTPGYQLYPETTSLGSLNDRYASSQEKYLYSRIGLEKDGKSVTDYTKGSTAAHKTRVVVIDTGIEYDHEEFLDANGHTRISPLSYSVTDGRTAAQGGYGILSDSDKITPGHGTLVTGIIFASADNGKGIAGLAPDVEMIMVKMTLNENGGYVYTDFLAALDYAATLNPDVVNVSLGAYGGYNYYHSRIKKMTDKGTVVVGAAGNSSISTVHYPSADENVVSVGAFADLSGLSQTNRNYSLASYSSFGDANIDICAPGRMYSTKVGNTYGVYNGTSFASPVVAAAVALYISVHPDDSRQTIVDNLYSSAYDQGDRGKDYIFGYGGLDTWNFIYGERGKVTFDDGMGGSTVCPITVGTALQSYPYPTSSPEGKVFDGWYLDAGYTTPVKNYTQVFAPGTVVYAKWSDTPSDASFDYTLNTAGEVILKGYYGGKKELFLPETLKTASGQKTVTGIAARAFERSDLTKIVLPDTVKTVGEYAFSNNAFEYVYLPSSVRTLDKYAFSSSSCNLYVEENIYSYTADWDSASRMTLYRNSGNFILTEEGMELLGNTEYTLLGFCGTVENLSTTRNVTSIHSEAFANNSTLREVSFPKVKTVGAGAFKNCTALYSIDLPAVVELGEESFAGCSLLQTYTMPGSLTTLGKNAFKNCSSLYSVDFSQATALKQLSDGAFSGCSALQTLDLSGATALTDIGRESFRSCTSLFVVSIPQTVALIDYNAFGGCNSLTVLRLPFLGRTDRSDELNTHLGYIFGTSNPAYQNGVVPASLKYVYVTKSNLSSTSLDKLSGITVYAKGTYGGNASCSVLQSGNFATLELYADGKLCGIYGGAKGSALNASLLNGCYVAPSGKTCTGWEGLGATLSDGKANMRFSTNVYKITFADYNGTVLSEKTYAFGDKVSEPAFPSRASTAQYDYRFIGWDKKVAPVTGEQKYTAVYEETLRTYTVTFSDSDGKVLSRNQVAYGVTPTAPMLSDKPVSESHYDRFTGWNKQISPVTGDASYTAVYQRELRQYTITFRYEDGSIFAVQSYAHGSAITPPDTLRAPDAQYVYTFKNWDKSMATVTGDGEYTAIYSKQLRSYTVRFEDYDGKLISENTYHYGEAVSLPANPVRESSAEYKYVFNGWSPSVTSVAGDAVYTATYKDESRLLTVLFKNSDGSLISSKQYYAGETLEVPSTIPTRTGVDKNYYYVFEGWSPALQMTVNENADYKAEYTRKYYEYIVMFLDSDGSVLSTANYRYGATVSVPANPADKGDYVFVGWDKKIGKVDGDAVYTAVYEYVPYVPSEDELISSFRAAVAAVNDSASLNERFHQIRTALGYYEQITAKEQVETEYNRLCAAIEGYNADVADLNDAYTRAESTALGALSSAKVALALTAQVTTLSAAAYVCGLSNKNY